MNHFFFFLTTEVAISAIPTIPIVIAVERFLSPNKSPSNIMYAPTNARTIPKVKVVLCIFSSKNLTYINLMAEKYLIGNFKY